MQRFRFVLFSLPGLLAATVVFWAGCWEAGHTPIPRNPPVKVSEDDPRIFPMLQELRRASTNYGVATIPTPLLGSDELRLEPLPHDGDANLYFINAGRARIMHFRRAPDGYRWHGEIMVYGAGLGFGNQLFAIPEVRRALAEWDKPQPPKTRSLTFQAVNSVRSASVRLSNTNGSWLGRPSE